MDEPGPISDDEEDYLDYLLGDGCDNDESEGDIFEPSLFQESNVSSQSSQSTSASEDPLARPDVYWRDENDTDTGSPDPRSIPFRPAIPPGIQLDMFTRNASKVYRKPVDFLKLFLTTELVLQICIATNHFAECMIAKGDNLSYAASDGTWERVTVDEMYRFLGIVIYMSIVKLQTIDRHWNSGPLYKNSVVASVMTIRRFKALLSFLQINGDPDKDDKITRVRPLIDHIQEVSQKLFHPYRRISVDERMVASKHKFSGIRQFVKDKPIRFGIKLWVLADTLTGYTFSFFVYLGKKRTELINKTKGLAYSVVMNLSNVLFGQGYTLFTDRFYTTQHLANDLLENNVYLIGAVKNSSTAMPHCFKADLTLFDKYAKRGDFRWHREGNFAMCNGLIVKL